MSPRLILYSRAECCLCDDMKAIIARVARKIPLDLIEVDIDSSADLRARYGTEIPVLFIDGRKAFKYRLSASELEKSLRRRSADA